MPGSPPKRKASNLEPPTQEENPVERKRVLNVLAQRRYRQRKKEHLQRLQQKVGDQTDGEAFLYLHGDLSTLSASPHTTNNSTLNEPSAPRWTDTETTVKNWPVDNGGNGATAKEYYSTDAKTFEAWNPTAFFPTPPFSRSPTPDSGWYNSTGQYWSSNASPDRSISSIGTSPSVGADERNLPVLQLGLLRATIAIAKMLDIDNLVWDMDALSPFCQNGHRQASAQDFSHLPPNLRPTQIQRSFPHHPLLDTLPWPATRDRLIAIFSQPIEMRPKIARSPTAFCDFAYDMEDPAEGIRIWGKDPYDPEGWEIGQKLFREWWWAFDREVVRNSNQFRRQRGATLLGSDASRVIEEIE